MKTVEIDSANDELGGLRPLRLIRSHSLSPIMPSPSLFCFRWRILTLKRHR